MRRTLLALTLFCVAMQVASASPQLLLTPPRLKRLKRDCDRQTPRWINFDNRVKTVADSPERGFELALYYVVTGDEARGLEAVRWAKAHPCQLRQFALVKDWTGPLFNQDQSPSVAAKCVVDPHSAASVRDQVFTNVMNGSAIDPEAGAAVIPALVNGGFHDPAELYAAAELFAVVKAQSRVDLREREPHFFASLPTLMLLSLKPQQVEHPDWLTHIAALALVSLDPNSNAAQFLQGWAIEDRQMLHEGPGVAYELLWADPYLPGVGYQNLDPWAFDENTGALVARTNWTPETCWVQIDSRGPHSEHCPAAWDHKPLDFGHLHLIPLLEKCAEVSRHPNDTVILSQLSPGQKLRYDDGSGKMQTANALPVGLWRVPVNAVGKVCTAR